MGLVEDDIEHPILDAIAGGSFGTVQILMQRTYPAESIPGDDN